MAFFGGHPNRSEVRAVPLRTLSLLVSLACVAQDAATRIPIGELPTGPLNAITDVEGVGVGHSTVRRGEDVRTGVTVVVPRMGANLWAEKLPAAVYTGNGYGKAAGFTQVEELGEIEAPIALTNTLSVGTVLDAMVRLSLEQPGSEEVRSINVVVGETNDGRLNDIRGRHVTAQHVEEAWSSASGRARGRGSRRGRHGHRLLRLQGRHRLVSRIVGKWTVGVLVQTNFGGKLRIDGRRFPDRRPRKRTTATARA